MVKFIFYIYEPKLKRSINYRKVITPSNRMVKSFLVYGILIKEENGKSLFPDLYSSDGGFHMDEITDYLNMEEDTPIKTHLIDFEYQNTYDKEGGEALLIGLTINKCQAHYGGVMEVVEVDEKSKKTMESFMNDNSNLKQLKLTLYVGVDAEK